MGELLHHGVEVAGLGLLAAPHIKHAITGKPVKKTTERNMELAGLGVLAAPSAYALGKHFLKKGSVDKTMMKAMSDELTKISGAFDRAARMASEAKGIVGKHPGMVTGKPASMIRGKPMTGMKIGGGIDRAALPKPQPFKTVSGG